MTTFNDSTISLQILNPERGEAENLKQNIENTDNSTDVICLSNVEYSVLPLIEDKKTRSNLKIIPYEDTLPQNSIYVLKNTPINAFNLSKKQTCNARITEISPHDLSIKKQKKVDAGVAQDKTNNLTYYKCINCLFLTLTKQNLDAHQQKHKNNYLNKPKKQINCQGCMNIFYSKKSYKIHLLYDHQMTANEVSLILKSISNQKLKKSSKTVKKQLRLLEQKENSEGNDTMVTIGVSNIISDDSTYHESTVQSEKNHLVVAEEVKLPTIVISDVNIDLVDAPTETSTEKENITSVKLETDSLNKQVKKPSVKNSERVTQIIEKETKVFKCRIPRCNIRLKSAFNIEYHLKCHHQNEFACPECLMTFAVWNSLRGHLWRKHEIDVELHKCDKCNYKTFSLSQLNNIHRRIHNDVKSFLCDVCPKAFKNPKQLLTHKTIHKPNYKMCNFICETCNRPFASRRLLKLHDEGVHQQLKRFTCNFCSYKANSKSAVQLHERKHTGDKPYACELCDYTTADHNSLRRHKLKHNGEFAYRCPYCSYACIQSSTFKIHIKSKHPNAEHEVTFTCNFCDFKSLRRDNYLTHIAKHEVVTSNISNNGGSLELEMKNADETGLLETSSRINNINVIGNTLVQNSTTDGAKKLDLYTIPLLINSNKNVATSTGSKPVANGSKFLFVSANELGSSNMDVSNTYVLDSSLVSCIYT